MQNRQDHSPEDQASSADAHSSQQGSPDEIPNESSDAPNGRTEDQKGHKPRAARQTKRKPSSGGMGHNSRHAMPGEAYENVATATFSEQTAATLTVVFAYVSTFVSCGKVVEKKGIAALIAIYSTIYEILWSGAESSFAKAHKIEAHGNVENWLQPWVGFFFRQVNQDEKSVRWIVSRMAKVAAVGWYSGLDPQAFHDWLHQTSMQQAELQYTSVKERLLPEETAAAQEARVALVREGFASDEDSPVCEPTRVTLERNECGVQLGVIEIDGDGRYRLRSIVDMRQPAVLDFLARLARKKRQTVG